MPRYAAVTDVDDPRLDAFRDVRERDLVGRQGRFIAEGEVVLRTAIRAGRFPLTRALIVDRRVDGLRDALDRLPPDAEVLCASQAVMDRIVGFPIHRGVLALGEGVDADPAALIAGLPNEALVLVLFGIGNHDNMGGLFRNAAAFGAGAVLVGRDCCDPLYRKAIRVSVGAVLTAPWARVGDDVLTALEDAGFELLALTPQGGEPLGRGPRRGRAALVLGAEGPGLRPEIMDRCRRLTIPMAGDFDSLNVATTGAVALWALAQG